MNWYDRGLLALVLVVVVLVSFKGRSASANSGTVRVVTVTNTVSVVASSGTENKRSFSLFGGGGGGASDVGPDRREVLPRVTCEYQPYSFVSYGFDRVKTFVVLRGCRMEKGNRNEDGLLVDVDENYLRFVADDGREHFVYKIEGGLVVPVSDDAYRQSTSTKTVSNR